MAEARAAVEEARVVGVAGDEIVLPIIMADDVAVVRHHETAELRRVVPVDELAHAVDDAVVETQVDCARDRALRTRDDVVATPGQRLRQPAAVGS